MSDWTSGGDWQYPENRGEMAASGASAGGESWWASPLPPQPAATQPSGWPPLPASKPPRSNRRAIRSLLSTAGALTVVAVVLPIVGSSSAADAAVVVSAAKLTASEQTAHIDLSGSVTVAGQSVDIGGSGSVDFAQNNASLTVNVNAGGQSESVSEVMLGGTMYEQVPGISTVEPGKSWISADIAAMEKEAGSSSPLSNIDPAAELALLEQQGASVSSLGSSVVDGADVTGYQVDISNSEIQSNLQKLPSWAQQATSQINFSGLTFDVYIDDANQFQRFSINANISVAGQTASINMNEDFSQYGAPVSISAPPADQVVSLQQFLQDAGVSGGS